MESLWTQPNNKPKYFSFNISNQKIDYYIEELCHVFANKLCLLLLQRITVQCIKKDLLNQNILNKYLYGIYLSIIIRVM